MSLRLDKVRELLRRELSLVIEKDYRMENGLLTVHDVSITPDLKQAFVYVGVISKPHQQEAAVEKLNKARGSIQRDLYKRVKLRNSPQLIFRLDHTTEKAVPLVQLIDSLPPPAEDTPPA
ncbi:MAG: 30S ribosome-binding factor RbfA [Verrucomicrobiaceae bacterium]|jgi:ribosome-binding factor A|nr:30S ribosome-binding factor RbfA [Verrucomicrobiaceae bacterium]